MEAVKKLNFFPNKYGVSKMFSPCTMKTWIMGDTANTRSANSYKLTKNRITPTPAMLQDHWIASIFDRCTMPKARVCSPDVSATLAQEMGVNWSKLKGRDKWHERITGR
jgi:hypothetical protein